MPDSAWLDQHAQLTLDRLLPALELRFAARTRSKVWRAFVQRLNVHFPRLFKLLFYLYSDQYDFFYHLETIVTTAARAALARSPELRALDAEREAEPQWFQSNQALGGVCYVDLFAGDLTGIQSKIPYFKEWA